MLHLLSTQLKLFLDTKQEVTRVSAQRILSLIYLLTFAGHSLIAVVFCACLRLYQAPTQAMPAILGWLLIALSAFQLPFAMLAGYAGSYRQSRQGILALTMLLAFLLANSVWIAGFAWLVGAGLWWLAGFGGIVMVYYALGFLLVVAFATWANAHKPDAETDADVETYTDVETSPDVESDTDSESDAESKAEVSDSASLAS